MATERGDESIVPAAGPSRATGHDTGEGSNNWIVGPTKSATGKPILCSDPHQPFGVPGQWLEAQITGPDFDTIGAIYVGTPGVYLGRNRHCAWGVTNHVAPARDVYLEEVDGERYRERGEWRPLAQREETIEVAGGAPERIVVRSTARGPLISDRPGMLPSLASVPDAPSGPASLAWVGHRSGSGFDAMLGLHRARNADDVLRALELWPCPPLNFVYADADGRFGYHVVGHLPRRRTGGRGFRRGGDAGDAWDGDLRFDELPQLADPGRGWVATANNPPWAGEQEHYISLAAWADGYRMARIRERLTAHDTLTPAQVAAVHADVYSIRARELVPSLVARLSGSKDRRVRAALARLRSWDHQFTIDSVAASIFASFWECWRSEIAAARFPAALVPIAAAQAGALGRALLLGEEVSWFDGKLGPHVERAFARALDRLAEAAGPRMAGWRWGRLHTLEQKHPLAAHPNAPKGMNVGPSPTSGGQTVRAAGYAVGEGPAATAFQATSGSIYRLVVDFAEPGRARAITPVGQSGHPGSRHYRDQAPLWLVDDYKPLWMDDADILANLEGSTTLVPR
jgi:penicillin amidase